MDAWPNGFMVVHQNGPFVLYCFYQISTFIESGATMNWREYIHADPNILAGKPVVKGTRLSVDFILRLFGNGWTTEQGWKAIPN